MTVPSPPPRGRVDTSAPLQLRPEAPAADGCVLRVSPAGPDWKYVSFGVYRLSPGERVVRPADDQEAIILVLEGYATVTSADRSFGRVGSRSSVFDGPPCPVVLIEPGRPVDIIASTDVLLALAAAPEGDIRRTVLISADEVAVERRGEGNTLRTIHHLLPPAAEAGRLIAFEAYTPAGNWSSYPPHKHDTEDPPRESYLEELYYHRLARPTGFAVQRVYTTDRSLDETMTVTDGDLVLVPRGYHVVGAAAGYDLYYLNVMAGPTRYWRFTVDPDHAWLMNWDPTQPRR